MLLNVRLRMCQSGSNLLGSHRHTPYQQAVKKSGKTIALFTGGGTESDSALGDLLAHASRIPVFILVLSVISDSSATREPRAATRKRPRGAKVRRGLILVPAKPIRVALVYGTHRYIALFRR